MARIPYTHGNPSDCPATGYTRWKYIPTSNGGPDVLLLASSCQPPNKRSMLVVDGYTGSLIESTLLAGTTYSEYRAIVCCLSSGATSGQVVMNLPIPGDAPVPGESIPSEDDSPSCPRNRPRANVSLLPVMRPLFRLACDLADNLEKLARSMRFLYVIVIILLLLCLILLFLLLTGK